MTAGRGLSFWQGAWEVARKDTLVHMRTKRLYMVGGFYVVAFTGLGLLFASFFNTFFEGIYDELRGTDFYVSKANVVMSLLLFLPLVGAGSLLQLLGIVFAYDSIVREHEDKTLFLVLSKPLSRPSFVAGKFLGSVFATSILHLIIATLVYFLIALLVGEMPTFDDGFRYYLASGLMLMGLLALASMALFVSAFARSTGASLTFSLLIWIVGLSVISQSASAAAIASDDFGRDDVLYKVAQYINPSVAVDAAVALLLDFEGMREAGVPLRAIEGFGIGGLDPFVSFLWLLGWVVVFVGATLLVVQRRDFE